MTRLPSNPAFDRFTAVDLNERGDLLHPRTGQPVPTDRVAEVFGEYLSVPKECTDIVVFVHGWRNDRQRANAAARQLFHGIETVYARDPGRYPKLDGLEGYYLIVRWPSMSSPMPWGYRRIRDRAHAMTTGGHAEFVLAWLLGYLNSQMTRASLAERQTQAGQYLHCVGHSFGGRFLGEAIMAAAQPQESVQLGWPWAHDEFPFTVDTLLVFQMAARPTVFADGFAPILQSAPLNAPVALTFSGHDLATRWWHRITEGVPGIGAFGATAPPEQIQPWKLLPLDRDYERGDPTKQIKNIDAGWLFRDGGLFNPSGAHSDIWHEESIHLLLSLANLAR